MAVINPPMTTVARGLCTSAPREVETAMGMNPKLATDAVIKTGRSRSDAPSRIASKIFLPPPRSESMWLTMTTPFRTATPNKAIKPMEADKLRFKPRIHNAATPPTSAKGTIIKIRRAWRAD